MRPVSATLNATPWMIVSLLVGFSNVHAHSWIPISWIPDVCCQFVELLLMKKIPWSWQGIFRFICNLCMCSELISTSFFRYHVCHKVDNSKCILHTSYTIGLYRTRGIGPGLYDHLAPYPWPRIPVGFYPGPDPTYLLPDKNHRLLLSFDIEVNIINKLIL